MTTINPSADSFLDAKRDPLVMDSIQAMLTPREVADRLKVPLQTVYWWLQRNRLPHMRLGRRYRVNSADLSWVINISGPEGVPNDNAFSRSTAGGRTGGDGHFHRPLIVAVIANTELREVFSTVCRRFDCQTLIVSDAFSAIEMCDNLDVDILCFELEDSVKHLWQLRKACAGDASKLKIMALQNNHRHLVVPPLGSPNVPVTVLFGPVSDSIIAKALGTFGLELLPKM